MVKATYFVKSVLKKLLVTSAFFMSFASSATFITYTDLSSYNAATTNSVVEDFEGMIPLNNNIFNTGYSNGWNFGGGVTFRSLTNGYSSANTSNYMAVLGAAYYAPYYSRGTGDELHATSDNWLRMDIASGTKAVAALWSTIFRGGDTLSVRFSNGEATSFVTDQSNWKFQGWKFDSNIYWVEVRAPGDYMMVDNFTYSNVAQVSEPTSFSVICLGLVALILGARSRKLRVKQLA